MGLAILGLGTAQPLHSIAQDDAAELAKAFCCHTNEHARLLPILYQRTQIQQRGSVLLESADGAGVQQSFFSPAVGHVDHGPTTGRRMQRYAQEAGPLALTAARRALDESQLPAAQVTDLITISCTGFVAPGIDVQLMKALNLPSALQRTHIGFMGCHGALNGLRVASALAEAEPSARILLCAVELCSLHFCYGWDSGKIVANSLFADGAAALVAGAQGRATDQEWRVVATGSYLFPNSEDAMTWRIGDHGFEMTLSTNVPLLLRAHLRAWLERWLARYELQMRQIRSWAIHPGGPRILQTAASCLNLTDDAIAVSREVLAECGNMSSATILFVLERLRRRGAPRPCVALGFGPGLAAEVVLFA